MGVTNPLVRKAGYFLGNRGIGGWSLTKFQVWLSQVLMLSNGGQECDSGGGGDVECIICLFHSFSI